MVEDVIKEKNDETNVTTSEKKATKDKSDKELIRFKAFEKAILDVNKLLKPKKGEE